MTSWSVRAREPFAVPLVEVAISEALVHAAVPRASARFDAVLALRPMSVVVDVSRCPLVDAAAIALLLDVHRRLWRANGLLSLRSPGPRLRRLLQVARVDSVLHIVPDSGATAEPPLEACR